MTSSPLNEHTAFHTDRLETDHQAAAVQWRDEMALAFGILMTLACGFYIYVFLQLRREEKHPGWRQRKLQGEILEFRRKLKQEEDAGPRKGPTKPGQAADGAGTPKNASSLRRVLPMRSAINTDHSVSAIRRRSHA